MTSELLGLRSETRVLGDNSWRFSYSALSVNWAPLEPEPDCVSPRTGAGRRSPPRKLVCLIDVHRILQTVKTDSLVESGLAVENSKDGKIEKSKTEKSKDGKIERRKNRKIEKSKKGETDFLQKRPR